MTIASFGTNRVALQLARFASVAVPLLALALLVPLLGPVADRVLVDGLIKVVIVIGFWIFIGNSGVISFGQAAFMIIAAYASAWVTMPVVIKSIMLPQLPAALKAIQLHPALGITVAVAASSLVALLVGAVLMRLSGIAASIATFAFFGIVSTIYGNWTTWTKGTASLVGLPVFVTPAVALAAALGALLVAQTYAASKRGLLLRACREDEVAARASGISIFGERLVAFVLSAAVVAVGGALQGHFVGTLTTANNTYFNFQFVALAMLVAGGLRSLSGAVAGVILLSVLIEILRQAENGFSVAGLTLALPAGSREVGLGVALLLILIFRPGGLFGERELVSPRRVTRHRQLVGLRLR